MAEILGKREDASYYLGKSNKVKKMFEKYMIGKDGVIKAGRQAPHVRAIAFDLCGEEKKGLVLTYLAELVRKNGYHLNTGFLSTPFILSVLADAGYVEEAYKLLEQESSPSWLYNVKKGATTILEQWTGLDEHAYSYNHYSYGAVCDFLFTRVAGIRPVLEEPGYKKIWIRPCVGGTLQYSKADYESIYGKIHSEWVKIGEEVKYSFEIPPNTSAVLSLGTSEEKMESLKKSYPSATYENGYATFTVGSGTYEMVL